MIPLLVLRPEPGAAATAARAAALGLVPIVAPLFTIEPVAWTPRPPADFDALMLTSANAVRHAGPALAHYRALPVFAVGAATAAAAREAGFAEIHTADGDATDLAALLAQAGIGRALHLCGADRREAAAAGVRIDRVAVYRAAAVVDLPDAVVGALAAHPSHPGPVPGSTGKHIRPQLVAHYGGPRNGSGVTEEVYVRAEFARNGAGMTAQAHRAVALLHSPRAASLFTGLLDAATRARIAIAAISPAAVDAAGPGWRAVAVAPMPTDAALLAVASRLCEDGG